MESNILCPISYEIMEDPVILVESGQTYDRENITKWVETKRTDPISGINFCVINTQSNNSSKYR